jgi:hypothetical protein
MESKPASVAVPAAPARTALARDPLSADEILTGFYRPERSAWAPVDEADAEPEEPRRGPAARPRPTHYKVVCISLYNEDIERLESLVAELKRRGHSKANKSQVIREALLQIDLDAVPRQH